MIGAMAHSYPTPFQTAVLSLFPVGTMPHSAILSGILATVATVMIRLRD